MSLFKPGSMDSIDLRKLVNYCNGKYGSCERVNAFSGEEAHFFRFANVLLCQEKLAPHLNLP